MSCGSSAFKYYTFSHVAIGVLRMAIIPLVCFLPGCGCIACMLPSVVMNDPDLGWAQVRRKTFLQTNDLFVWETGDRVGRDAGWVFAGFGWWYISYCRTGYLIFTGYLVEANWVRGYRV